MRVEFLANEDWFDLGISVLPNKGNYFEHKYTLRIGLAFWAIQVDFVKNTEVEQKGWFTQIEFLSLGIIKNKGYERQRFEK